MNVLREVLDVGQSSGAARAAVSRALAPHAYPGDSAMTGEGRLYALNMFDAKMVCSGGAYAIDAQGNSKPLALINRRADTRSRYDPLALVPTARDWCAG